MSNVGAIDKLPHAMRAAVKRAIASNARRGAGDINDLVVFVARAVWRAGVAQGRAIALAQGQVGGLDHEKRRVNR